MPFQQLVEELNAKFDPFLKHKGAFYPSIGIEPGGCFL
jgi:hypothetical protein